MKKRKWLSAFTLICALVGSFAFFGCDDIANSGGKVDGDTKPADIVSHQLTEEEWKAAFADGNFINYSVNSKMTETVGEESAIVTTELKYDGTKQYVKQIGEYKDQVIRGENYYSVEKGQTYEYRYDQTTETWSRQETNINISGVETANFLYMLIKDSFSEFTYDNVLKAYTAAAYLLTGVDVGTTMKNVVLKFTDKKLSYLEFSIDGGILAFDGPTKFEGIFYDYGTTTVILPTISAK